MTSTIYTIVLTSKQLQELIEHKIIYITNNDGFWPITLKKANEFATHRREIVLHDEDAAQLKETKKMIRGYHEIIVCD